MAPPTTNLKKYQCEMCPKAYTAQSNLCTHYRSAHPDEPTPSFRTERTAKVDKTELSDIKDLIMKLASGELTTEALVRMAGIEIQEPVTPTLDIGQLVNLNLEGLPPADMLERRKIVWDHLYFHLFKTGVYDEVYSSIINEDYDVAFYKAFKDQIFCDKGIISYRDDEEIAEMDQSEVNVCTLFKLLCDMILYNLSNEVEEGLKQDNSEYGIPEKFRERFDTITDERYALSSSMSISGNKKIVTNPNSVFTSRPATRSLSISYACVRKCLPKFNRPLEI